MLVQALGTFGIFAPERMAQCFRPLQVPLCLGGIMDGADDWNDWPEVARSWPVDRSRKRRVKWGQRQLVGRSGPGQTRSQSSASLRSELLLQLMKALLDLGSFRFWSREMTSRANTVLGKAPLVLAS